LILIVGGNSQGKLQFAMQLLDIREEMVSDGGTCDLDQAFAKPVLNRLHLLIKRTGEQGLDAAGFIMEGIRSNPDITVISDELGLGVIPVDPQDRELQELTGRIQCMLAQKASRVYRVHCSVPVLIKG
jgi:adenosylcobinamide kinase/adenosylcobinamide-phosphate guanylyltransferase